jgi:hypothetical protein
MRHWPTHTDRFVEALETSDLLQRARATSIRYLPGIRGSCRLALPLALRGAVSSAAGSHNPVHLTRYAHRTAAAAAITADLGEHSSQMIIWRIATMTPATNRNGREGDVQIAAACTFGNGLVRENGCVG